jgi:16S rRNA (guanine966-N2)-methyltransferase
MRIVAGQWRGRRIEAPPGEHVRPTRDRVREAWLSIVHPYLPGARVADLFAGSGALGIEALSRGAAFAEFVDTHSKSVAVLKANLELLGALPQAKIHRTDALRFVSTLEEHSFDVVFADPPYATDAAVQLAERWLVLPYASILSVEHASTVIMPPGGDTRRYGTSHITFYRAG